MNPYMEGDPIARQQKDQQLARRRKLGAAGFVAGLALMGGSGVAVLHGNNTNFDARDRFDTIHTHYKPEELATAQKVRESYIKIAQNAGSTGEIGSLESRVNTAEVQQAYTMQHNQEVYLTDRAQVTEGNGEVVLGIFGVMSSFLVTISGEGLYLKNGGKIWPSRKNEKTPQLT